MNSGGTGGTVGSIVTNSSGSTVSVSYPASVGPPPQAAHVDIYDPCPAWALAALRSAKACKTTVDVAVDGTGAPTSVKEN